MNDPYRVLGVRRGATDDEIRTAYRRRAKAIHPDTVPELRRDEATRRFQDLQEAYALLSDPKLRMALDQSRPAPWRPFRRRGPSEEEAVEEFFRNLLRSMMR
ncbi:MAG: J domain-containing protein [Thermaerobacter sp.]|nr:J domain-containing protein [Thermaerobacter sp.]